MSVDNFNTESNSDKSVDSKTTEKNESSNQSRKCTYWTRHDSREFITDPNGDVVNLARLTAYAEYGDAVYDVHVHHEIPPLKIDAPAFLRPLPAVEHGRFHGQDPNPVEVDGVPRLRPEK